MTPDQQDWQDELREQIQGARHMAEVSPDLVRRALIHMDAAVREVGRLQAAHDADLARLRALEGEKRDLGAQLYAATERVQHLLTTIDVERTARKEAEAEVARLRRVLGGLPSRFEVERLFGGACCERLLVPNGTGGVVFCDLLQDHIGSHEGADDKGNRWWFNESGAGILRTTHPTTGLPLEANRQIFASVHNRTLAALDAALHAQDTEVGR